METQEKDRLYFLDGLRGWGAVAVLNGHLFVLFLFKDSPFAQHAFKVVPFLFDGTQAVFLFFVVSGFALTTPYFRGGRKSHFLVEGAVKRYPRLTIPIICSSLIAYVLMSLRLIHRDSAAGSVSALGWLETLYLFEPDFVHFLWFSIFDVYANFKVTHSYNVVLWTMSIELAGSLIVFGFLGLFGRWRFRLVAYLFAVALLLRSPFLPFIVGTILAEVYWRTLALPTKLNNLDNWLRNSPWASLVLLTMAVLFWLLGNISLAPPYLYFRTIAGMTLIGGTLVAAAMYSGSVGLFFSSPLSRTLGKLSFSLYLVHFPIICSWSAWLYVRLLTEEFHLGLVRILVGISTLLFVVFLSYFFQKLVDAPSLSLSRWLGKKSIRAGQRYSYLS